MDGIATHQNDPRAGADNVRILDRFERGFEHPTSPAPNVPRDISTPSEEGHEWTTLDERFCDHHADCGAAQLAELLATTPLDVIRHMGALGVDVPPVPLLGEVCPSCGGRMPVRGRARESGICDACHTRLMYELRTAKRAEDRNRREADAEAHAVHRGAGESDWSYAPWRDDGVER